jgi:large subunit ribosomal protein L21
MTMATTAKKAVTKKAAPKNKATDAPKKVAKKVVAKPNEFAVIATGGKQYKVHVGDVLKIEKMKGEFAEGDKMTFSEVLLYENGETTTIGMPHVDGKTVEAIFVKADRLPKVNIIKYKSKSRYFKKNGHRQPYFEVKISAIK